VSKTILRRRRPPRILTEMRICDLSDRPRKKTPCVERRAQVGGNSTKGTQASREARSRPRSRHSEVFLKTVRDLADCRAD
jgi:hypothetical protein